MTCNPPPLLPVARTSQLANWLWLLGCAAILLAAAWLSTEGERRVSLPGVGVLPETCTLYSRWGLECPGCGLTRCFIRLAHGQWSAAWKTHPLGPLLFAFVALQLPLAGSRLLPPRALAIGPLAASRRLLERLVNWNQWILLGLMAGLLLRWVLKMLTGVG